MAVPEPVPQPTLIENGSPLIGIFLLKNGRTFVQYYMSEDEADAAVPADSTQRALELAGAWSDLDWDQMEAALDHIRHESQPTPVIDDL